MTSLAKQLQRLAVPHTQAVLGDDRKKASLLFDPKEAASIDRETFHELGVNGLDELETIDGEFQIFETSLFGDSSLTFERSVQTKEVNEKLDETIKKFLIRLSPYCLQRPAHKALEWLIHRFHVHLYNTDDLLLCFLPYHENKIFSRVLQLIRFDSKIASKWDWLEPLQKSGVHLSRTTLVNHCGTDPAFLSYVCDMVPQAVMVLTDTYLTSKCGVLFSFYASTLIGVLDSVPVTEVILSTILPHLCRGMKSAITEYKAASYMILAQLLYKVNLKPALVKTLQHILAKSIKTELMQEAMACMLLLFQTQDVTSVGVSKKTFKHICSHYTIIETIAQLYVQFDAKTFMLCFLLRLIPAAFQHAVGLATSGESSASESNSNLQEYRSLLHRLLSTVNLPEDVAEEAAFKFLSLYIQHGKKYLDKDVDERVKENLQGIVRQLEGKHSAAVDRAVNRTLSESQSKQERDLVQEFLNLYVLSVPHQVIGDTETSLVLSLNHRLASVREKAVLTLIQNRDMVEDESLIQNSLSLRLHDEDPQVIAAALTVGQDLWSIIHDDGVTMQLLQTPLLKGIDSPLWHKPGTVSARILGAYDGDISLEVFVSCLPCLFVRQESQYNMEIAEILLTSALMTKHSILMKIAEEWRTSRKILETRTLSDGLVSQEIARCIAIGLRDDINENGLENVTVWTKHASEGQNCQVSSLMLIVLDDLITMTTDVRVRLHICRLQTELINALQMKQKTDSSSKRYSWDNVGDNWDCIIASTKAYLKEKVPSLFCLKALYSIVSSLKVPSQLELDTSTWQLRGDDGEDVFLLLVVQLYSIFLDRVDRDSRNVHYYRNLLNVLQTHVNGKSSDLGLTLTLQTRSLKYGLDIIQATRDDEESKKILLSSADMMSSILVILVSEQLPVRQAGICYTKELMSLAEQTCVYLQLLQKIDSCQTEILADHAYLKQVIVSIFNTTPLTKKSPIQSSRKSKGSQRSGTKLNIMSDNECALLEMVNLIVDEHTPDYQQYALLEIFSVLNNQDILTALLPLLDRLVCQTGKSMTVTASKSIILLIQRFTLDTTACLSSKSNGLKLFIQVLKLTGNNVEGSASPQLVAISQISKQLFMALENDSQHALLSALFDVYVETKNTIVTDQIRKVMRHLSVDGNHIVEELKKCLKEPIASTVRQAKKLKRMEPEVPVLASSEFDTQVWHRVVIVLESVQTKKKIANFTAIVPVCFSILSSILNSDNHMSAEYIKQLILTLLQNICGKMETSADKRDVVPESQFNMDLIVNCIRSSDNPQTHHQALLLLTAAAKIYPEHLLHNMMSVFTFMGANIMRKDDAYSFLIISKILETVIPALITACEQRKCVPKGITNDLEDIITIVIQVFVDSYPYIPEHRRHLLFNKLLTVINEEKYLWRTLLLLMKHVATKGTLKTELASELQESLGNIPTNDTEFCLSLCADFTCAIQLSATRDMIEYLLKLPDDKEDEPVKKCKQPLTSFGNMCKEDAAIFNVVVHTSKQLRYFKYATVNLLVNLFSSPDFITQVAREDKELLPHFQCVLEKVLTCVSHVTHTANRSSSKPTARFWRILQQKTHEMLDKLVSLLPNTMFIDVIGGLLSNDLPTIQRKAMELLNIKLQQQHKLENSEVNALLPIVKQLREFVCEISQSSHMSEDNIINCQAAFVCLKLLCRNIGFQHREEFIQVLQTSIEIFKCESTGMQVRSCTLLCIAEICRTIKVYMIQYLPSFIPALITVLTDQEQLLMKEWYLISVVTTVNKVVENLSHFLSPYLHDILTQVCILSSKSSKWDILQKPQVQQRLKMIRTTLSTCTPTRVLLPVVSSCFATLVSSSLVSISSLMSLLSDHITQISQEDLSSHLGQLQSFFLTCLDIRTDYPGISKKKLSLLEGVTIDTIITMTLKLSEATFKPFLFKIFDWATTNEQYKERVLVFYSLAARLAERLRSLFTIFAGHIMENAAMMLDQNNKMKRGKKFFPLDKSKRRKSCQLLENILDTIYRCCLYDTEGFVNKDRFNMLMQPLVDQIENDQGGEELFEQRINQHLVPCIVQMCVAVHDDSLWQSLNYQVCLKTRNQDTKEKLEKMRNFCVEKCGNPTFEVFSHIHSNVKKAALTTLDALNKKLGEDYLSLLPDTIPFLAELMEDESEEVEKKCHEMIRVMEKTLGEPLQKYF